MQVISFLLVLLCSFIAAVHMKEVPSGLLGRLTEELRQQQPNEDGMPLASPSALTASACDVAKSLCECTIDEARTANKAAEWQSECLDDFVKKTVLDAVKPAFKVAVEQGVEHLIGTWPFAPPMVICDINIINYFPWFSFKWCHNSHKSSFQHTTCKAHNSYKSFKCAKYITDAEPFPRECFVPCFTKGTKTDHPIGGKLKALKTELKKFPAVPITVATPTQWEVVRPHLAALRTEVFTEAKFSDLRTELCKWETDGGGCSA